MTFDPPSCQPVVFKNNIGVIGLWVFMACWMPMLIYLTRIDAGVSGGRLTLFWVLSLGFAAVAFCVRLVRVEISHAGVLVRERALLWSRTRQFAARELSVSGIVESEDSEGGVTYSCALKLPDDASVDPCEQHVALRGGAAAPPVVERVDHRGAKSP